MKSLILTLIFAVVTTTIGAGWMISAFHSRVYRSSAEADQNLIAYKQLGQEIGQTLENYPEREEFVAHWKENSNTEISFQERSDFLVPDELAIDFANGKTLLLGSSEEMSLHLYLPGTGQVMSLVSPITGSRQGSLFNLILTLLFYLIVVAALLVWLYPLIKRLVMLQRAADRIGTGDLTARVSESKYSYISGIESVFNRMADQIEKLVSDNQLLGRAVSHNLKTPITRLRMGVDVLEEAKDQSELDGYIQRINNDLDEMQSLVEILLEYSRLDESKLPFKNELIDLCQFLPRLIESERVPGIDITTDFSDDSLLVNTDPKYLAMSLVNILSNANQHAKSCVSVKVDSLSMDRKNQVIAISVEDDGDGISESDHFHVTKPFWRGCSDPAVKGHGMGLAIVDRIAEWLQAELTINRSSSLGGASVTLVFQATKQSIVGLKKRNPNERIGFPAVNSRAFPSDV